MSLVADENAKFEMDEEGYPTEATLAAIRTWPAQDFGLISKLKEIWNYANYISDEGDETISVSTGGWSGHEDIIAAMQENAMWWTLHWFESRRGGHYKFRPVYTLAQAHEQISAEEPVR